jgi:hypothetical protein
MKLKNKKGNNMKWNILNNLIWDLNHPKGTILIICIVNKHRELIHRFSKNKNLIFIPYNRPIRARGLRINGYKVLDNLTLNQEWKDIINGSMMPDSKTLETYKILMAGRGWGMSTLAFIDAIKYSK